MMTDSERYEQMLGQLKTTARGLSFKELQELILQVRFTKAQKRRKNAQPSR